MNTGLLVLVFVTVACEREHDDIVTLFIPSNSLIIIVVNVLLLLLLFFVHDAAIRPGVNYIALKSSITSITITITITG